VEVSHVVGIDVGTWAGDFRAALGDCGRHSAFRRRPMNFVVIATTLLVFGYLTYVMVRPEQF
jgi:hypothetical protein